MAASSDSHDPRPSCRHDICETDEASHNFPSTYNYVRSDIIDRCSNPASAVLPTRKTLEIRVGHGVPPVFPDQRGEP